LSKHHLVFFAISTFLLVASCSSRQSNNQQASQRSSNQEPTNTLMTFDVPERLFLQQVSSSSAIIKWRGEPNQLWFGTGETGLTSHVVAEIDSNHKLARLTELTPETRYYYSFTNSPAANYIASFRTAPRSGEVPEDGNTHIWLLGDSGTATEQSGGQFSHAGEAVEVMNGFLKYNRESANDKTLDLLLLLGDNAYPAGTDDQWQGAFFDIYTDVIQSVATWPTIGNHEMGVGAPFDICVFRSLPACEAGPVMMNFGGISRSSDPKSYDGDGNGPDASGLPYLNIFSLPSRGELGGVPSGTEQYYAFNHSNVHIVSLDSQLSNRNKDQRAAMREWLIDDLSANMMDWTVVIFHHPPYSKGSNHDSDREQNEIDMRQTFAPVFEDHGVDVVYSGHAHSYERTWHINGHYDDSDTFDPTKHAQLNADGQPSLGQLSEPYKQTSESSNSNDHTVYTVAGSSGKADKEKPCKKDVVLGCTLPDWLQHPAHRVFTQAKPGYKKHGLALKGSVVLDIKKNELTSRFVDEHGEVLDYFTIIRETQ
jgi:hypothetical protein